MMVPSRVALDGRKVSEHVWSGRERDGENGVLVMGLILLFSSDNHGEICGSIRVGRVSYSRFGDCEWRRFPGGERGVLYDVDSLSSWIRW